MRAACSQEAALCGVHALNTLLQGPYFTAVDLSQVPCCTTLHVRRAGTQQHCALIRCPAACLQIAQELDALEKQYMAESGVEGEDFVNFLAEESGNVSSDGFFSIQVPLMGCWEASECRVHASGAHHELRAHPCAACRPPCRC